MNLIIKYFKPDNLQRHSEFLACLHENIPLFDKIYIFAEDTLNFTAPNIQIINTGEYLTFKDYFEFCNKLGGICVVANGDIIFDETINILKETNLDNIFVALARNDKVTQASSQDVWAFKVPIKVRDDMNFGFGRRGNDNRLAFIMHELGYEVRNPALQIKTKHFHLSEYRPNLALEEVKSPYLCLVPNDDINKKTDYIFTENLW